MEHWRGASETAASDALLKATDSKENQMGGELSNRNLKTCK